MNSHARIQQLSDEIAYLRNRVDELLARDDVSRHFSTVPARVLLSGTLNAGTLASPTSASADVYEWNPTTSQYSDTAQNVTVYNTKTISLTSGDQAEALLMPWGRWELVSGAKQYGRLIYGYLQFTLGQGGAQTLDIWEKDSLDMEGPTGATVTVWDALLCDGESIETGTKVLAEWHDKDVEYKVIAAACCSTESAALDALQDLGDAQGGGLAMAETLAEGTDGAIDTFDFMNGSNTAADAI